MSTIKGTKTMLPRVCPFFKTDRTRLLLNETHIKLAKKTT